jgi:DNA polymerase-3 subunit alpha
MAMVALYRPGPMEIIPEYIKRKHNPSSVTYPHPKLKNILERTFGLLIYQDDVMRTAMEVAGYDAEEADQFRKAMGKKIKSLMQQQKIKFIDGCVDNNLSHSQAQKIWGYIEPFAGYGFNKSHSASYAVVAYQTAYMKANYPAEFMAALMTAESGNTDKIAEAVTECGRLNIKVLPPDINQSLADFTYISDNEIRFGLAAIKNLGSDIIQTIVEERKANGPFASLECFLSRVHSRNLNKKSIEALIKAGAMDNLGERNQMLNNINKLLAFVKTHERERNSGQFSLFGAKTKENGMTLVLDPSQPAEEKMKLVWEKELLGLYVSSHPFKALASHFETQTANIYNILNNEYVPNSIVSVAGIISHVKKIFTKKNELMMFVTVEDLGGSMELIIFPSLLKKNSILWAEDKFILISGRLSDKDDLPKIIVESALEIDPLNPTGVLRNTNYKPKGFNKHNNQRRSMNVFISINHKNFNTQLHNQLKNIFQACYGKNQVFLQVKQNDKTRTIATSFYIDFNQQIKSDIEKISGPNSLTTQTLKNNH